MSVQISVTGIKEIDAVLKGMPLILQDRVLKTAHADAAKPLVQAASALAPLGKTGNLKKSIGVERISIKKVDAIGLVQVGPLRKGGRKGFHGHLIEYGKTNRDGSRTKPQPFMGPAFDQTQRIVEAGIAQSIGTKLYQFMNRTIKK